MLGRVICREDEYRVSFGLNIESELYPVRMSILNKV